MRRAIFRYCVLVAMIALVIGAAISSLILYTMRTQEIEANMKLVLFSVKSQIEYDIEHGIFSPDDEVQKYTDYRLSIIDADGTVIADSSVPARQLENHSDRPELIEAKALETGSSVRFSRTLGTMVTYMAMRVDDNLYIRIAMENDVLNTIFKSLLPSVIIGLILAAFITPVVAENVTKKIVQPLFRARDHIEKIAAGGDIAMLPSPEYEELIPIMDSVNTLSMRVSDTLGQLRNERERTKTLLDNMEEGLAVIDNRLRIASVNNACERYMGATQTRGRNIIYLTRDNRVLSAIEAAVRWGQSTIFDVPSHEGGRVLCARITPARGSTALTGEDTEEHGAILLLTDVTHTRENEKIRSEFVANASHELKTPITSIKGFAELLASGLVEDGHIAADYLGRITDEASRMTSLINDIIKISELEAGGVAEPAKQIDLAAIARETAEHIAPIAAQKGVSVTVLGENCMLRARHEDVRQIIDNLMDNAVKYNKQGGTVTVTCQNLSDKVSVSVVDTGIGIPREHHARVFERFYCVDKGRSRTVGGTGLGLSIVKHTVASLGGEIVFESKEGIGTTITVHFPNRPAQNQ